MTSDDERWERDLRAGLSALLTDVVPAQPPVAAVLRKGRAMRISRRLAVTAGTAAVTVAAVVVAAVVIGPAQRSGRQPPTSRGSGPPGNGVVINRGVIEGRAWRVVVDQAAGRLCAGEAGLRQSCVGLASLEHLSGLASLSGTLVAQDLHPPVNSNGPEVWDALFGVVRPDVTRIAMRMSNGSTVSLHPIAAAGYRWVGLVLRFMGPGVTRAIAYSGTTELGYSVPFYGGELRPGTYFVTWLRPGETGPARQSRYIATGRSGGNGWSAYVAAGPWGYCVSLEVPVTNGARQNCWSASALSSQVIMASGPPSVVPRWLVGVVQSWVAYLRIMLADGRSYRVRVIDVSGAKFFAMEVGRGTAIVGWRAYNASGRLFYGGHGAPVGG